MSKAEEFIKNKSHIIENPTSVWISSYNARRAVEIAREEMIDWIEDNIEQYPVDNWDRFVNSFITDLKQAIKDGR